MQSEFRGPDMRKFDCSLPLESQRGRGRGGGRKKGTDSRRKKCGLCEVCC